MVSIKFFKWGVCQLFLLTLIFDCMERLRQIGSLWTLCKSYNLCTEIKKSAGGTFQSTHYQSRICKKMFLAGISQLSIMVWPTIHPADNIINSYDIFCLYFSKRNIHTWDICLEERLFYLFQIDSYKNSCSCRLTKIVLSPVAAMFQYQLQILHSRKGQTSLLLNNAKKFKKINSNGQHCGSRLHQNIFAKNICFRTNRKWKTRQQNQNSFSWKHLWSFSYNSLRK